MFTENLPKSQFSIRRSLSLFVLCCALTTSVALARDFHSHAVHYLAKELAVDGVTPEAVAHKIQPELLMKLESDAEKAYFKGTEAPVERAIVVSLQVDRQRRSELLADKSQLGRSVLQQKVRASQDRVLRAVATKDRRGFTLRNRYKTLASFSAYADFHAVAALALQADVSYVEEMPVFEAHALLDGNADDTTDTSLAHNIPVLGAGVTIAVIDSGIDYTHSRLGGGSFPNSKVIGGWDFGDDDADPKTNCNGDQHGTATAFIAAGDGGVAPDAKLVHLKIQSSSNCGNLKFDGDVVGALDWTVTNQATYGIDIVSMSFGSGLYSNVCSNVGGAYPRALDDAAAAGMLLIASSGNDADKGKIGFPACRSSVTSVGAVYDRDWSSTLKYSDCKDKKPNRSEVTCYSNSASFLDILGPATCAKVAKTGGGIKDCFGGTSAAAPFVAGVAALAKSKRPSLTNEQLETVLVDTGISVTDPDNGVTTPVVNSVRAVLGATWWPYY